MNFRMVLRSLGIVLICEAICILPSLLVAAIYGDGDAPAFLQTIAILVIFGLLLLLNKPSSRIMYARDGFAIVALGWFMISFFGALPFYINGAIPSIIDSFFESVSGFTTTGASILKQVEGFPRGLLFWRSFTHWIGGMGVLVLTLAILPSVGAGTIHIMKAESPGPIQSKLVPKIGQTAKILYSIYIVITLLEIALLIAAGMPVYDSFIHTFGTVGTGGFSNMNASIGEYNSVRIEIIISVFMLACGVNFSLYYQLLKGNIKSIFRDEEFRFYIGVVAISMVLIALNIHGTVFKSIWESLRHSIFQVSSIITTTGYTSTDFNKWPVFSKAILVLLMLFGACSGSTGGGIKNIRVLLLLKIAKRELIKVMHPRLVCTVKIGGKSVGDETLSSVTAFFFLYVIILITAVIIVSLDCTDAETALTSVVATIGNIGPGLGMVGPMGNFTSFSDFSKFILSLCMIIGRLEIYPVMLLFIPTFWRRVNI